MSCFNVLSMYKVNILDNILCHNNHHIDSSDITMGISPVLEKKSTDMSVTRGTMRLNTATYT